MLRILSHQTPSPRLLQRLAASGLPRAVQHMLRGKFAIFTAFKPELYSPEENQQRLMELKREVRKLGLGFFDTFGAWRPEGSEKFLLEDSIFIAGIDEEDAARLAAKWEQESYIWGDEGIYWLKDVKTSSVISEGYVTDDFRLVTKDSPSNFFTGFKRRDDRVFVLDPERKQKLPENEVVPESSPQTIKLPDQRLASSRKATQFFFSLKNDCKYLSKQYGIRRLSDSAPDACLCEAWIPLREVH